MHICNTNIMHICIFQPIRDSSASVACCQKIELVAYTGKVWHDLSLRNYNSQQLNYSASLLKAFVYLDRKL